MKFSIICPNCGEQSVKQEFLNNVQVCATATHYGAVEVKLHCLTCGFTEDVTEETRQVSKGRFDNISENWTE